MAYEIENHYSWAFTLSATIGAGNIGATSFTFQPNTRIVLTGFGLRGRRASTGGANTASPLLTAGLAYSAGSSPYNIIDNFVTGSTRTNYEWTFTNSTPKDTCLLELPAGSPVTVTLTAYDAFIASDTQVWNVFMEWESLLFKN